jgi:glutamate-1-semialdehyde 2,1-aminomutase
MFTVFFDSGPVVDYNSALKSDTRRFAKYFRQMLGSGIYLPPSQFEANFLSTRHSEKHLAQTIAALRKCSL